MNTTKLFTSESVTEGHPDKVCDYIADSILDAILTQDKTARVACEVAATTGNVIIMGEITANATVNYEKVAREAISRIGYNQQELGFSADSVKVTTLVHTQSPDIAMGVDADGAGDQGMMFGYATQENPALMPHAVYLAHKLTKALSDARHSGLLPFLRPDGKAQVSIEYDGLTPKAISAVVLSTQHDEKITIDELRGTLMTEIIKKTLPSDMLSANTAYHINPTGRFVIGGPHGDSGVTGRKIIVDTYGGACTHGGGAFSGKDPTKVDRSGAYFARYVAKNIVSAGLAKQARVDIAYAIGVAEPVSIEVYTYGTNTIPEAEIVKLVKKTFDFTPKGIISALDLRNPIYNKTTNYGHFGRDGFSWEKTGVIK